MQSYAVRHYAVSHQCMLTHRTVLMAPAVEICWSNKTHRVVLGASIFNYLWQRKADLARHEALGEHCSQACMYVTAQAVWECGDDPFRLKATSLYIPCDGDYTMHKCGVSLVYVQCFCLSALVHWCTTWQPTTLLQESQLCSRNTECHWGDVVTLIMKGCNGVNGNLKMAV